MWSNELPPYSSCELGLVPSGRIPVWHLVCPKDGLQEGENCDTLSGHAVTGLLASYPYPE